MKAYIKVRWREVMEIENATFVEINGGVATIVDVLSYVKIKFFIKRFN